MIMRRKPGDMLSYLEYIIQVIHSLLMNRDLHIVSYVLLLSLLNSSCTSSFPAFSRAAWARRSAPRVPTTTGSCASERRSSLRRSIDSRGGEKLLCRYSSSYPNLQKQILITLNKVLHNPKATLPSVFGVIEGRDSSRFSCSHHAHGGGNGAESAAAAGCGHGGEHELHTREDALCSRGGASASMHACTHRRAARDCEL